MHIYFEFLLFWISVRSQLEQKYRYLFQHNLISLIPILIRAKNGVILEFIQFNLS